jgi:hypothetical protein
MAPVETRDGGGQGGVGFGGADFGGMGFVPKGINVDTYVNGFFSFGATILFLFG